jgi:hypothetical protein
VSQEARLKTLMAAVVLLTAPGAVSAATFAGSWEVSGSALADPGLVVATTPDGGGSFAFELAGGQSTSFSLFRLWSPEGSVGSDDLVPGALDVRFRLSGGASGVVTGTTAGHRLLGLQWGSADWREPLALDLGDGGVLSVVLDDAVFNAGFLALGRGEGYGADVRATFSYVAPVPLPAGAGLLLIGLGALGLLAAGRRPA